MAAPGGLFLSHVDPELLVDALELTALRRGIAPPDVEQKRLEQEAGRRGLLVYDTFTEFVQARRPDLMDHAYIRRQVRVAEKVIDGRIKNVLVLIPTQYGKALADDTPIATPNGWRTMGDLQPGDEVFGPDGRPTRVTAVPFRGVCPTYWVHAEGGGAVRASADHLWDVCAPMGGARSVRTTQDLAEHGVSARYGVTATYIGDGPVARDVRIPVAAALEMPDADLPIPPYVLGAWLGDGSSSGASMAIGHKDAPEMIEAFRRDGYALEKKRGGETAGCAAYAIIGSGGQWDKQDGFVIKLRRMGVFGNKHIPDEYLFASRAQRLALLQGLVDTDGSVCKRSGRAFFGNTNKRLIDAVHTLALSLGAKAMVRGKRATLYGKDCGPTWDVAFYLPEAARLQRKVALIKPGYQVSTQKRARTITFEPAPPCATTCISVAHPSGLFLAGKNLMVTHNSSVWSQLLPAYYLLRHGSRRVALSSYGAELAWEHSGEARDLYAMAGGQFKEGNPKGATRNWRTARTQGARGGMWATGIGGPSLGRGYHLGITDDPIDPLQVSSTAFQKRFRNWWPAKWLRGQRPNAAKVFVMQRLGLDDPVAWLLEREEDPQVAEHWHIVAFDEIKSADPFGRWSGPQGFPKTCTVEPDPRPTGTVLAPKFRPRSHVLHMQATAGPIVASAQRQQRPMMASGDFWPLSAFADRIYDILPPDAIDGGWDWDTAYTEKAENSASAGVQSFRSAGERATCTIYIHNVWWDWLKFPELVNHIKALQGPHYVEAKASGKSLVQVLAGYSIQALDVKVSGGKLERAAAAQPAPMGGRVYVRRLVWQKLLYGEGQGLLRVTAEALRQEQAAGLDVNDAFVQAIWRQLDLASKRKRAIAR